MELKILSLMNVKKVNLNNLDSKNFVLEETGFQNKYKNNKITSEANKYSIYSAERPYCLFGIELLSDSEGRTKRERRVCEIEVSSYIYIYYYEKDKEKVESIIKDIVVFKK